MPVRDQVLEYLNSVRRRWRLAATARGVAIASVTAFVLTVLAVLWSNAWRFSDTSVRSSRIVMILAILAALALFLVRPLLERLSDARLARFIEEKNPQLRDRLVTAVDLAGKSSTDRNAKLFEELLAQDALAKTASAPPDSLIERRKIFRPFLWAAISLGLILALGIFGPGVFRYGTKILWVGWAQGKTLPLYQLQLLPGDITVGRKSDQEITARPVGFLPEAVRIFILNQGNLGWESASMLPEERGGGFRFLLMNVHEPIEYYAESNGVRSQHYKISVIDVPRVERLEVRYHYPAYTGLKDTVENSGGDIIALKGTQVTIVAHTDSPADGGRMVLDDGSDFKMKKVGDRELETTVPVSKDAMYHIQLQDNHGSEAKASDEYVIQALIDAPPTLKIVRPGHDLQPSPIEEVVIGLQAQDDVRMGELQLHYSVNGGDEKTVVLGRGGMEKELSASHTLSLEDFHLVPGDLISFYGVAKDAASNTAKTEMFFLQVRPYERNYTQAQTAGGAGGQSEQNTFLSEREKQVLAATWNVIRKEKQKPEQIAGQAQVLGSVQRTLKEQAENMAERTKSRELTDVNEEFASLAENLKKAADAMGTAAGSLEKQKFQQALQPEQTALQHLMRAEATYRDIQVAMGNGGGGGGAGGASRDLADLFALELDTGKNQYETMKEMGNQENNASADDAMKKLEELARRQEDLSRQEKETKKDSLRAANRWEQEMLRRETEELARRLEQLSKEMNSQQMAQASNALSQAAKDMQQAANQQNSQQRGQQNGQQSGQQSSQGSQQGGQQSGRQSGQGGQSSGQQGGQQDGQQQAGQQGSGGTSERARAEERLREAGNLISGQRNLWDQEAVRKLAENAEQMAREQQKIANDVRRAAGGNPGAGQEGAESQEGSQQSSQGGNRQGMGSQGSQQSSQGRTQQEAQIGLTPGPQRDALQHMMENKRDLLEALNTLNRQINEAAGRLAGNQKKTSQKLRGAASLIEDQRMEDKLRQGAFLEQRGMFPMAAPAENDLRAGMDQLAERLKDAQKSLEQNGAGDKLQEALNLAERVRQGLESLERQRNGAEGGPDNRNGEQGFQQGQKGQQGQQGGQGQQGKQGQNSQQGQQAGQGQQGQQGKQGQGEGSQAGQSGQSGQNGQGSQGGQGGQSGQGGQGGDSMASGNPSGGQRGGSSAGNGGGTFGGRAQLPGGANSTQMSAEEAKELDQRLQELTRQASGLRSLVSDDQGLGKLAEDLASAMRNLDARKFTGNSRDLDRIAAGLIDQWKELELRLNRRLQGDKSDPVRLANQERVPDKYRAILEEYYRSLSKGPR